MLCTHSLLLFGLFLLCLHFRCFFVCSCSLASRRFPFTDGTLKRRTSPGCRATLWTLMSFVLDQRNLCIHVHVPFVTPIAVDPWFWTPWLRSRTSKTPPWPSDGFDAKRHLFSHHTLYMHGRIVFYRSCREGICGSCAMNINGTFV